MVELNEPNTSCVAAATLQLVDALTGSAAEFVTISHSSLGGSYWAAHHPKYGAHLNRGKRVHEVEHMEDVQTLVSEAAAAGKKVLFLWWEIVILYIWIGIGGGGFESARKFDVPDWDGSCKLTATHLECGVGVCNTFWVG